MVTWGALPAVRIDSASGARATVTLYGGHLVAWSAADGAQRLFCSALSARDGSRAIRGGVPVIFPQFAERGSGTRHGFARTSTWRLAGSGDGFAVFELGRADLSAAAAAAWPHAFTLQLRVALQGSTIDLALEVRNEGDSPFPFASALHTYFAVDDLAQVRIAGVQADLLQLEDKLDRIYRDIGGAITLAHAGGALQLDQSGFRDAVVWNPGAADTAALADMEDGDYRHFVCVEAALIEPLTLAPGQLWRGAHQISVVEQA